MGFFYVGIYDTWRKAPIIQGTMFPELRYYLKKQYPALLQFRASFWGTLPPPPLFWPLASTRAVMSSTSQREFEQNYFRAVRVIFRPNRNTNQSLLPAQQRSSETLSALLPHRPQAYTHTHPTHTAAAAAAARVAEKA